MKVQKISLGKFGDHILPSETIFDNALGIRLNGRKSYKATEYSPIATNGQNVLSGNSVINIEEYFTKNKKVIVLTQKERELLLDYICYQDIKVKVFENDFPVFEGLKYTGDLHKTYSILKSKIKKIESLGIYPQSLFKHFSDVHRRAIYKKQSRKNDLDSAFFFCDFKSYQEVFKFKEEDSERCVIALDFNSMYSSCLDIKLPDPAKLKFKTWNGEPADVIEPGIYKVILSKPKNSFIKHYHPFKLFKYSKNITFNLKDNHSLELLISSDELIYFKTHFFNVEVISSITSKDYVNHPRVKYAQRKHKERSLLHLSAIEKAVNKINLVSIHSSTNPKAMINTLFESFDNLKKFLEINYAIDFQNMQTMEDTFAYIETLPGFEVFKKNGRLGLSSPNLFNDKSIVCFSALIAASARVKLMKILEYTLEFKSTELCYINTDSIHLSLKKEMLDKFLEYMESYLGNELGKLKIESIADKGYWFDVGRYWLIKNNTVTKYKNIMFNTKNSTDSFTRDTKKIELSTSSFIRTYKIKYFNIRSCFSYTKRLNIDNNTFERYDFPEISTDMSAGSTMTNERICSENDKIRLFNKISE